VTLSLQMGECDGVPPCDSRGTDELLGVMERVDIINSTLGKALGGAAGTNFLFECVLGVHRPIGTHRRLFIIDKVTFWTKQANEQMTPRFRVTLIRCKVRRREY